MSNEGKWACHKAPRQEGSETLHAGKVISAEVWLHRPGNVSVPTSSRTCRTKYLDDAIQFFAGGGAVSAKLTQYLQQIEKLALTERNMSTELLRHAQVVLVGAGMDTRAHRLDLPPGLTWFEVDRAEVLRVKQKVLSKLKRKSTRVSVQSAGGLPRWEILCTTYWSARFTHHACHHTACIKNLT